MYDNIRHVNRLICSYQPAPLLILFYLKHLPIHKNVEPVLLPVPHSKGSRIALFVETSNAESPTPMLMYMTRRTIPTRVFKAETALGLYKHPKGRSRCFVFDEQLELARFLECQNQSVQKTPVCIECLYSFPYIFKYRLRGRTANLEKNFF